MSKVFLIFLLPLSVLSVKGQVRIDKILNQAKIEIQQENYSQGVQTLNRIIILDHDNFEAWYLRGLAKYYLRDRAGAVRDISRAIELNPAISSYYLLRGILWDMQGDQYKALEDFTAGLSIQPNDASLYYSRGTTRLRLNNYSLAVEDFDEAIRINDRLDEAYINRGIAKMSLLNYDGALEDFDKAIQINAFSGEAFNRKGLLYYEKKDFRKAIEAFDAALIRDPANPQNYYFRALTYYESGKKDSCLLDLSKVLEIDPQHSLSLYNRAIIRSQMKDYEGAIADYEAVNRLHPYHVLTYFNRGLLKQQTGDTQGALWDFDRAILIYPDFAKAYQARASIKQTLGDNLGAQTDLLIADEKIKQNFGKKENDLALNYSDTTVGFQDLITLNSRFSGTFRKQYEEEIQQGELFGYEKLVVREDSLFIEIQNLDWEKRSFMLRSQVRTFLDAYAQDTLVKYAILKGQTQEFNEGIKVLDEILYNNPKNALAFMARAQLKFEMIEFVRSTDLITNMVPLQMDGNPIQFENQSPQIDYSGVLDDYGELLELRPDLAVAWMNRGFVKVYNRSYAGAIYDFSRAVGLIPDYAACWYNLGITQVKTTNGEEGCLNLSKAGELGLERAYRSISLFCSSN